jgi:hypothetical protein
VARCGKAWLGQARHGWATHGMARQGMAWFSKFSFQFCNAWRGRAAAVRMPLLREIAHCKWNTRSWTVSEPMVTFF